MFLKCAHFVYNYITQDRPQIGWLFLLKVKIKSIVKEQGRCYVCRWCKQSCQLVFWLSEMFFMHFKIIFIFLVFLIFEEHQLGTAYNSASKVKYFAYFSVIELFYMNFTLKKYAISSYNYIFFINLFLCIIFSFVIIVHISFAY